MFDNPNKNAKVESVEDAKDRGVKVEKCPPTPVKGKYEFEYKYCSRVKKACKQSIEVNHIPPELRYLLD